MSSMLCREIVQAVVATVRKVGLAGLWVCATVAYAQSNNCSNGFTICPQDHWVCQNGETAEFKASHPNTIGIAWRLNGTPYQSIIPIPLGTKKDSTETVGTFSITASLLPNGTTIQAISSLQDLTAVESRIAHLFYRNPTRAYITDTNAAQQGNIVQLNWSAPTVTTDENRMIYDLEYTINILDADDNMLATEKPEPVSATQFTWPIPDRHRCEQRPLSFVVQADYCSGASTVTNTSPQPQAVSVRVTLSETPARITGVEAASHCDYFSIRWDSVESPEGLPAPQYTVFIESNNQTEADDIEIRGLNETWYHFQPATATALDDFSFSVTATYCAGRWPGQ